MPVARSCLKFAGALGEVHLIRLVSTMVILGCALVAEARSADVFTNFTADGGCVVTFYGEIETTDAAMFDALTPDCNGGGVLLKSDGGAVMAGLRIGELIREKGLETAVSWDARCASACALAWLGGTRRQMFATSLVGFHAAYVVKGTSAVESGFGNALVGAYLARLGLPTSAIIFMTSAEPTSMNWLDYREASSLGIDLSLLTAKDMDWINAIDTGRPHQ